MQRCKSPVTCSRLLSGQTLSDCSGFLRSIAMSRQGAVGAMSFSSGDISAIRFSKAGYDVHPLEGYGEGHVSLVDALRFSADGKWLLGGTVENDVFCWRTGGDFRARKPFAMHPGDGSPECAGFSADSSLLAWLSLSTSGGVVFLGLAPPLRDRPWEYYPPGKALRSLAFSPAGNRLACIDEAGDLRILRPTVGSSRVEGIAKGDITDYWTSRVVIVRSRVSSGFVP